MIVDITKKFYVRFIFEGPVLHLKYNKELLGIILALVRFIFLLSLFTDVAWA